MKKTVVSAENAPLPLARYSQGIKLDNMLYTQGMIAIDPATGRLVAGDIVVQAERVFESLESVLVAAGMHFKNVVKVTAYLANLEDYPKFNEIYNSRFSFDPPPVRTTVQAGLPMGALVEVEVIACAD